jgi:branched-subunit amino acid transport protein
MIMNDITLLIFLMALVTFIPRVVPILLLSKRELPAAITIWLSYVPVAVLAALLTPALLAPGGIINFGIETNPAFWVAIPVFAVAHLTKNLFATVLTGMILIALLRLFL